MLLLLEEFVVVIFFEFKIGVYWYIVFVGFIVILMFKILNIYILFWLWVFLDGFLDYLFFKLKVKFNNLLIWISLSFKIIKLENIY